MPINYGEGDIRSVRNLWADQSEFPLREGVVTNGTDVSSEARFSKFTQSLIWQVQQ
jgi:hypothetical protein